MLRLFNHFFFAVFVGVHVLSTLSVGSTQLSLLMSFGTFWEALAGVDRMTISPGPGTKQLALVLVCSDLNSHYSHYLIYFDLLNLFGLFGRDG